VLGDYRVLGNANHTARRTKPCASVLAEGHLHRSLGQRPRNGCSYECTVGTASRSCHGRQSWNERELFQDGLGSYADAPVVCQGTPANDTVAIENKDRRAGHILAFYRVASVVAKSKPVDRNQLGIRQYRIVQSQFLDNFGVLFNGIDANGQNFGAGRANVGNT